MIDIDKYIPTPDSVLKRKLENSHRYALAYLILCRHKRDKNNFILTKTFAQQLNKSYPESWSILNEFSNLGYLVQRKTSSKMTIFIIKDELITDEFIKIAVKNLEN